MREIFIVTHPQATHSVENLVGGWYESSLTEEGILDADRIASCLAKRLASTTRVHLVTSDLRRALQTAAPIAQRLGIQPTIDADLRERSYGSAEGSTPGTATFIQPPATGPRLDHHPGTAGTETLREWAGRAYRAIDRVLEAKAEYTVIVTHGGTLTYLISAWIGLPLENAGYAKFTSSPGGITHLSENDSTHDRQVITLNDTRHLSAPDGRPAPAPPRLPSRPGDE